MPWKCGIFTTLNHQASPLNSNSSVKFSLMTTFSTLEQMTHTIEYSPERTTCTSRHSPRGWHTTQGSCAPATPGRAATWPRAAGSLHLLPSAASLPSQDHSEQATLPPFPLTQILRLLCPSQPFSSFWALPSRPEPTCLTFSEATLQL